MPFSFLPHPLSLLCLLLFLSSSSCHRLSSILRQPSSPCPCVCQQLKKGTNLCDSVLQPHSCSMIRCPRPLGFACCGAGDPTQGPTPTPSRTPVPPPKPPGQVTPNIFRIRNNGISAAKTEPQLADRARQILLECSKQLDLLTEAVPVTVRVMGGDVVRMQTPSGSFKRFNKATGEVLLFIVSSLTLHNGK